MTAPHGEPAPDRSQPPPQQAADTPDQPPRDANRSKLLISTRPPLHDSAIYAVTAPVLRMPFHRTSEYLRKRCHAESQGRNPVSGESIFRRVFRDLSWCHRVL